MKRNNISLLIHDNDTGENLVINSKLCRHIIKLFEQIDRINKVGEMIGETNLAYDYIDTISRVVLFGVGISDELPNIEERRNEGQGERSGGLELTDTATPAPTGTSETQRTTL